MSVEQPSSTNAEYKAKGRDLRLLFGGRNRAALSGLQDVEPAARVFASTDDGSHGFRGMVTALLDDLIARGEVKAGGAKKPARG